MTQPRPPDPSGNPVVLAFSGGLDTSFCVPWLKETYGRDVITATINTGGIDDEAAAALRTRALTLGAVEHVLVDGRAEFFDTVLRFLIAGNVRRGQLYPLCVGAERGVQAAGLARIAAKFGAATVAHGCTAAGNDQVRFEVALRTLNPDLEILAPVRDNNWARQDQLDFLTARKLPHPSAGSVYSINRGLWGITIGGRETLTSEHSLPEDAWLLSPNAFREPLKPSDHVIEFERGIPVAFDGETFGPVTLIENVEKVAGRYAIGRGIHLGDTVLGTKGRVAFEAPAAETIIATHRELEKLVLSAQQARVKDMLANVYGDLVHEGKQLDLACRDLEALFASSQQRVSGTVRFTLRPGSLFVTGVSSPHSLMAASRGVYGESAGEWTAEDALGYSRILSLSGALQSRAAARTGE